MSIRQLDLVLLGRRAITSRIGSVEGTVRRIALAGYGDSELPSTAIVRPNLLDNSSFEYYQRNRTVADSWTFSGASIIPSAQADGLTAVSINAGGSVRQNVQGSTVFGKGALVLSVAARGGVAGLKIAFSVAHPSVVLGSVFRLAADGSVQQTDVVPADNQWYRFYVQGLTLASGSFEAVILAPGANGNSIEIDAAKFEFEPNAEGMIEPTAYQASDTGVATTLRNLRADNIVAGTLTVGGSGTEAPRISVLDANDTEIVTIGDANGTYGIEVKAAAGIEVSGAGSIAVTGGGNVEVSNGGAVNVTGTGGINVEGGGSIEVGDTGSVKVTGSGKIVAGAAGGARTEITDDGIAAYNGSNVKQIEIASADGRMYVYGEGGIVLSGGGSFIAGTPGGARAEYDETGFSSYSAANELQARMSAISGKLELSADAIVLLSSDPLELPALAVSGELTVGQDFRVGANVLFVDQSQSNVGINRAPDPQFDLDIAGSVRWGGYGVGKMALQLKDALLIAHYDGAGVVGTDLTGDPTGHKGQRATVTGSLSYPAGKFNKGVQLASGAQLAYTTSGNLLAASGTIAMWVKPTGTGQVMFGCGSVSPHWVRLAVGAGNILQGWYGNAALEVGTVTLNQWHHVALTWSGGAVSLYLNGALLGSASGATTPLLATQFYVGSDQGGGNRWTGVIDDLTILGVAADADLVRAIYESDAPVFAETSNWGFRTANTLAWADEEGLWAIDGSGNAAFAVSGVNSKSWGGQTLDRGDVFIGRSTSYAWWDASAGTLKIRGTLDASTVTGGTISGTTISGGTISGTTISGVTITGSTVTGGKVTLGNNGIDIYPTVGQYDSSASIDFYGTNGTTQIAQIYNGAGATTGVLYLFSRGDIALWASNGTSTQASLTVGSDGIAILAGSTAGVHLRDNMLKLFYGPASNYSSVYYQASVQIGSHPTYGNTYGAIWRKWVQSAPGGTVEQDYALLFGDADTSVNSRSGTIYFRDNNSNRAYINGTGLYVVGNLDAGFVQSRGWANFGSTGTNYWPSGSNWSSGGANLLLNGADYTSIAFHDGNNRVDAIIAGGGSIRIGPNIGWGVPTTEIGGPLSVAGNSTFTGRVAVNTAVWSGSALFINGFDNSPSWYGIVVRNSSSANLMYVRNDSYLWANRAWDTSSDARLKENIEDLKPERTRVKRVRYRKFKRLIDGRGDVGVVAQELREVYPELVTEVVHPTGDDNLPPGEPELAVNYQGLAVYLGKAVQELDDELDKVQKQAKRRIDDLEAANATLEARLVALEKLVNKLQK